MRNAALAILLSGAALTGCMKLPPVQSAAFENGQLVAQRQCSACHAVGAAGTSPRVEAPLFRTILSRYRSDVLEEELVERIKIGHSAMPEFQLNPAAASDLIVYLRSIQIPVASTGQ